MNLAMLVLKFHLPIYYGTQIKSASWLFLMLQKCWLVKNNYYYIYLVYLYEIIAKSACKVYLIATLPWGFRLTGVRVLFMNDIFWQLPLVLNAWNMAKPDKYGFRRTLASSILKPLLVRD
jgi:hypothetical protein